VQINMTPYQLRCRATRPRPPASRIGSGGHSGRGRRDSGFVYQAGWGPSAAWMRTRRPGAGALHQTFACAGSVGVGGVQADGEDDQPEQPPTLTAHLLLGESEFHEQVVCSFLFANE
jgi:hypothetical protein